MPAYQFHIDIPIRYGDLDPQGHVNNSQFFTFIEQARIDYLQHLGLWDGSSFMDLNLIVADAHMAFLAPLQLGETVRVGVRVTRLGNKSLRFEYELTSQPGGQVCGQGDTVMVSFDYRANQSIPIPAEWRTKIAVFEHISEQS